MSIPLPLATAMDRLMGAMSTLVQTAPGGHPDTGEQLDEYFGIPAERIFPEPPTPEHIYLSPQRARGKYVIEDFRFESAYQPWSDGYRRRHEREYNANRLVSGRIFRNPDGHPRPMALYVHGLMMPGPGLEERFFFPRILKEVDVDIVHLHLPFHGRRRPAGSMVHGKLFWTSDLVRSLEAMRQSVCDIRQVLSYLRGRFEAPTGLVGLSLGGVLTMTTLCVEPKIDFAVPIIAHQSITDAVVKAPIFTRMRRDLEGRGLAQADLKRIEERLGLAQLKPLIPLERMLWINARHDLFITAEAVEKQWIAWGRPPIRWYEGSHMSIAFEMDRVLSWIAEFLDSLALVPRHGLRRKRGRAA